MFEALFNNVVGIVPTSQRAEGAAFLKVARDLYQLSSLAYLALNISDVSGQPRYAHCSYTDTSVTQCLSAEPLSTIMLDELGLTTAERDWEPGTWEVALNGSDEGPAVGVMHAATFPVPSRQGELAIFGFTANTNSAEWQRRKTEIMREIRILGDYLHSHVLRINGHNVDAQILVSARELDCLKWTAAGKTAWEASVILGISERTVRFHLNAAREKLDCATTTQAVAKAITCRLIELSPNDL
jgi:DNA-binding CsgD family transcriptional regulator